MKSRRNAKEPDDKTACDKTITDRLLSYKPYVSSDTVFVYVSKKIEISTEEIIKRSIKSGKIVAVPKCIPETYGMEFYRIHSLNELAPGAYGVFEPTAGVPLIKDFSKGVCIVPGLGFDIHGYRLGYGKGYYDRFLSSFGGVSIGLCYSRCVQPYLPHGKFDRQVHFLVTEKYLRKINS
jgi:5-formyltetrahydrofolate cyclo-ligase